MFLNIFLFFTNIMIISFCSTYITHLYTDLKKVNNHKKKVKENKTKHKISYQDQLDYISDIQEIDRENFKIFYFRVLFLVVAITMALFIRIEPLILFGVKLNLFHIIGIIIILNIIQSYILKKLGVKT